MNKIDEAYNHASDRIRHVLLEIWDPVGINDVLPKDYDAVKDEYDYYINPILALKRQGATQQDIADYLARAQAEETSRTLPPERSTLAAKLIFEVDIYH